MFTHLLERLSRKSAVVRLTKVHKMSKLTKRKVIFPVTRIILVNVIIIVYCLERRKFQFYSGLPTITNLLGIHFEDVVTISFDVYTLCSTK